MKKEILEDSQSLLKTPNPLSHHSSIQPLESQLLAHHLKPPSTLNVVDSHKSMPNLPSDPYLSEKSSTLPRHPHLPNEIIIAGDLGLAIIGKDKNIVVSSCLDYNNLLSARMINFNGKRFFMY
jgi:hypothetical protein